MARVITFLVGLVARFFSVVAELYGTWMLTRSIHEEEDGDWKGPGFFSDLIEFGRHLLQTIARSVCGSERETVREYGYSDCRPGLYR